MTSWLRRVGDRLAAPLGDRPRVAGVPPSANGASSFHLGWVLPASDPLVEVTATLTVLVPPAVDRLYFWALQASFHDGRRSRGAAHLGLQWCPGHPGSAAVNWGGYGEDGAELGGTESALPSGRRNVNTRDYPWRPERPYRLRIHAAPGGAGWRGEVTDTATGDATTVRDLHAPGPYLAGPVVWSEVFARCDDPSVIVRWSDMAGRTAAGAVVPAAAVRLSFQARADGGCDNTDVDVEDGAVLQVTNAVRRHPAGTVVPLS